MQTPTQVIARIDRKINAVHKELRRRERFDGLSSHCWQRAWDLHPELHRREKNLFWLRGEFQQRRAQEEMKRLARQPHLPRPRKCPTCHGTGRSA